MVGHQLPQHRHEDVDGVSGLARRTCQAAAAHRVIGAIHLRAAVDQKNARGRGHRSEMGGKSREKNEYIIRRMAVVSSRSWGAVMWRQRVALVLLAMVAIAAS